LKRVITVLFGMVVLQTALVAQAPAGNAALQFGSPGSVVLVPNSPSINLSGPITIEAWVKADPSTPSNSLNFILSKQLNGTGYTLLANLLSGGSKVFQFQSYNVGGSGVRYFVNSSSIVPLSVWTHVAAVWNTSGIASIYVNGKLDGTTTVPSPPVPNTQDLQIGNSVFGDDLRWHGLIDEVRIWNVTRSANDIDGFMRIAADVPIPGLVARWGFGEGSGAVAHDSSGNHNDGTITAATFTTVSDLPLTPLSTIPTLACAYSLLQANQTFPPDGGSGAATVVAPAGCSWTANNSGAPWVTFTGFTNGSGDGTVSYTIAANTSGIARTGTLIIGGQTYTVVQAAAVSASCSATVASPPQVALEGRTELLGDLVLTCNGLTSDVNASFSLTLNTNVTNTLSGLDTLDARLVSGGNSLNGHIAGYNIIRWTGVTLGPGIGKVTITNVRADASLLSPGGSLGLLPIIGQVSVNIGSFVPVSYATQTSACGLAAGNAETMACAARTLVFQKGQASPPSGGAQTTIPLVYQEAAAASFHASGTTSATRLRMVLSNVPSSVLVYAPVYPSESPTRAQLYSADANGYGGAPVSGSPFAGGTYQQLTVNGGIATATWVVLAADATQVETWTFSLLVTNAAIGDLNQMQVAASLAPVSDVSVASVTAPIPRYRDFSVPQKLVNLRMTTSVQAPGGGASLTPLLRTEALAGSGLAATVGSTLTLISKLLNDTSDPSQTATNVVIRDNLPSGLILVSCSASGGPSCIISGNQVQVNIASLGPGQSTAVTLVAQVDPSLIGGTILENEVSGSSDQPNLDLLTSTASSSFVVLSLGGVPVAAGATPASGSGVSQSFTFLFSDPAGYQSLGVVNVLINNFLDGRHACYLAYAVPSTTMYLVDDAGDAGGPYAGSVVLGTSTTVQNSQCAVSLTSAVGSGTTLILTLNIAFKPPFGGNKVMYVAARDQAQGNSDWQALGVWQPATSMTGTISVAGTTPNRGAAPAGASQQFNFTLADTNGTGDFGVINVLVNNFIDGRKACYLAYVASTRTLYLVDDAGDAGGPFAGGMVLNGTNGGIQNGHCSVNGSGSVVTPGDATLTLTLNITFTSTFAGNRVVYVAVRGGSGGNNTGWQAMGTWTVQ